MMYFITGGERSGKSRYAQQLALRLSNSPVYLATARRWDEDFEKRIQRHVSERDERWTNIEEQVELHTAIPAHAIVVIDCITLWLTNIFAAYKGNIDESLVKAKHVFDELRKANATLIIISNEIGMGVHASSESGRKFVELQGWINQHIAAGAEEVVLMVSGIPMLIKSNINNEATARVHKLERR
jgi:adenosylcobinamide kinase/adenosylcobinamide-phosphate guanylyltransferase